MFKNVLANILGKFWSVVSSFIFVPLYIKYLGIESYSVISFTLLLIGLSSVMDAGLTATLSREFARAESNEQRKKVFYTLEYCYFGIVILIFTILISSSNYIAHHWINLISLSPDLVSDSIKIFAFVLGFQFLSNFYIGGLLGLERQVLANGYQIVWGITKNAIVVLVIIYFPNLLYFFLWQLVTTFIYIIYIRYQLLKLIGSPNFSFFEIKKFDVEVFNSLKKFVSGLFLIALVTAINMQLDKLVISNFLPINQLGYYSLAVTLSTTLLYLISPISVALLPKFTYYFNNNMQKEANQLFNNAFCVVTLFISVGLATIIVYGNRLIFIWTGDQTIADASNQYLMFSAIGFSALALQVIPYDIVISNGNTKINNYTGIISILFTIPSYWFGVKYYGALGASITWCISQGIITPIFIYLVLRNYLPNQNYLNIIFIKILLPIFISIVVSYSLSKIIPFFQNRIFNFITIVSCALLVLIINFLFTATKELKVSVFNILHQFKR
jgi:O-antigen/teichoic acid export membrane protein